MKHKTIIDLERFRNTKIQPYDPAWPDYYAAEQQKLKAVLKGILYRTHHIGSTAVPDLSAKAVIDILVVVEDVALLEQYKLQLAALGYHWMGEYGISGRRYLWKADQSGVNFHLQCFAHESGHVRNALIFRNYLRSHADQAQYYTAAKIAAANQYPNDAHAYHAAKRATVEQILQSALQWQEFKKNLSVAHEGKNYDAIAHDFAFARDVASERKYLDELIQLLPSGAEILDVGCGSGYPNAAYLIAHGFRVTGIDASQELLKQAAKLVPAMPIIHGDMRSIDVSNTYAAILAWDSFFHLPKLDQQYMIARFAAWLQPDGIVLFTSGDADGEVIKAEMFGELFSYYSLSPETYLQILAENNFKLLRKEKDQDEEQHLVWLARKLSS